MAYRWTHRQPLTRIGGDDVAPDSVFDPTDAELQSFADCIEAVESGGSDAESTDPQDQDANEESDGAKGRDYASMDYAELRQLAADADTDAINGKSSKDEIVAYFAEE